MAEYFKKRFLNMKQFSLQKTQNPKYEGMFSIYDNSINSFYVNQIKDDLKSFEQDNKIKHKKDVNIQNHRFLIENAILKGADQREIRK